MHFVSNRCIIEHLRLHGGSAGDLIDTAAACAQATLVDYQAAPSETATSGRVRGDALLLSVGTIDETALLAMAELRKRTPGRMILLASWATAEQRIGALSLGIDHVLVEPVDVRELAAVLRNATRGMRPAGGHGRASERGYRWHLDDERWVLVAPNLRETRLTRAEHDILRALFDRPSTVLQRCDLVSAMNGPSGRGGSRALDVQLSRLRHKVWECAQLELPLRSARNAGYVFAGLIGQAGGA